MKGFQSLHFSLTISILFSSWAQLRESYGTRLVRAVTPWPWTPLTKPEILQNYEDFSLSLMRASDLTHVNTVAHVPFSLGQALGVLNERVVLNVSTDRLESVLRTPSHKIAKSYEKLLSILSSDPDVSITSTIYTQQNKALLTVGLGKLRTNVNLVDVPKNAQEVIEYVNSELSKKVKNDAEIGNKFFPSGKPESVLGFLTNTFLYENGWGLSWTQAPEHSFQSFYASSPLPFMMASGRLKVFQTEEFVLIRVPLKAERKHVVLAKSKKFINEWSESVGSIWKDFVSTFFSLKGSEFTEKSVQLKMPQFEAISGASYYEPLTELGLNETMCTRNRRGRRIIRLGHLSQLTRLQVSPSIFKLTAITGLKGTQERSRSRKRTDQVPVIVGTGNEEGTSIAVDHSSPKEGRRNIGDDGTTLDLTLDQPFFWVLQDEDLGAIALGAVLNPHGGPSNIPSNYMEPFMECTSK